MCHYYSLEYYPNVRFLFTSFEVSFFELLFGVALLVLYTFCVVGIGEIVGFMLVANLRTKDNIEQKMQTPKDVQNISKPVEILDSIHITWDIYELL